MDRVRDPTPANAGWQRDLSVSYDKVGNAQLAQRNPMAAITSYQASLAISDRLEKSDPVTPIGSAISAISYAKVGDAQSAQGNLTAALISYQAGLAGRGPTGEIRSQQMPGWQRDLSVSLRQPCTRFTEHGRQSRRHSTSCGRAKPSWPA